MRKLGTALLAVTLAFSAGCSVSKAKYVAATEKYVDMTCENLDNELILAESSKEIKIIRRFQGEKGCEIKPLLAENQQEDRATRRDRKLRPPGFERRPVGFQRAERAVLRDRNTARRGGRPLR